MVKVMLWTFLALVLVIDITFYELLSWWVLLVSVFMIGTSIWMTVLHRTSRKK